MNRTTLIPVLILGMSGVLALSGFLTLAARRVAQRIGFVDTPGGHKSHREPVPYAGGVAIFLAAWSCLGGALLLAAIIPQSWIAQNWGETIRAYVGGIQTRTPQMLIILAGGFVLHVMGLLDDRRPLPAILKLVAIVGVALFVAAMGKVRVAELAGREVSIALTVVWYIVIVNAFNFLDNMDGLSAGVACICLATFAVCGLLAGQVLIPALAGVFLGAIGGFLVFNFPPARIFMGDAGSLVIGYMLATVSVMTTYYQSGEQTPPYALAMPLVILAIPLYDFISVVVIRLSESRNPMQGDQRHFSHRLVERGLSRRFAVLTIYLATATTALTATLLPTANLRQTITVGVIVLMILSVIAILESPLRSES